MLDIRVIRDNPTAVQDRLKSRGGDHWKLVADVLECDHLRRASETAKQELEAARKRISKQIGILKAKGDEKAVSGVKEKVLRLTARFPLP